MPFYMSITWKTLNNTVLHYWVRVIFLTYLEDMTNRIQDIVKLGVIEVIDVVSSNTAHGEVNSLQHYVIKFGSDLRQIGGFLRVLSFHLPIKLNAILYINNMENIKQYSSTLLG
jgi:hypothetical protein